MLNLDQITEQGVRLDLQGLVILKDWKRSTEKRKREWGVRDKVRENNERGEVCFEFVYKTTHLWLFITVCAQVVVYVCECFYVTQYKGTGE